MERIEDGLGISRKTSSGVAAGNVFRAACVPAQHSRCDLCRLRVQDTPTWRWWIRLSYWRWRRGRSAGHRRVRARQTVDPRALAAVRAIDHRRRGDGIDERVPERVA